MAGFHDGIVQYWDAPKFTKGGRTQLHNEPVDCVAADPGEKIIATVGRKTGKVRLWEFPTWRMLAEITPSSKAAIVA